MTKINSAVKSLLLSGFLATSIIAPHAALAQNATALAINLRSEDGLYRPGLRVIIGGQVYFFRVNDTQTENPLTEQILRNSSALMAWLAQQFPGITFSIAALPDSKPKANDGKDDDVCPPRECETLL